MEKLPAGPRGNLFRQLLPGIQPVLSTLEAVADSRRKSMSQVRARNSC
jgi:pyridoxine 4-dehydrogenase